MLHCRNWVGALSLVLMCHAAAFAEEDKGELRWKFAKGQSFAYQVEQDVTLAITIGTTTTKTTTHQTLDLVWTVDDVNEETGDAELTQKITRVVLTIDSPATGKVELDTDAKADSTGVAKLIAPLLKALVGAKVEMRMSPRGDINEVDVSKDLFAKFKQVPGAAMFGDMFSQESFRNLIKQASMVLPKGAPKKGDTHTQLHVIKNKLLGKMTAVTTYTFAGTESVDGRDLAKFDIVLKLAFDKEKQGVAKVEIKSQESSGALHFDADKGRIDRSAVHQKLRLEVSIAGQKVQQEITSHTRLKAK